MSKVVAGSIEAGSRVFIGRPARPMPDQVSSAIAKLVSRTAGVDEAHLPQMYIPQTMSAPAQVLLARRVVGAQGVRR